MPKKPSRKSPEKDENGGKLGQFTTEVNKTFEDGKKEGKEEQKKESAESFRRVLDDIEKSHKIEIALAKDEGIEIGRRYHKAAFYYTLFYGGFLGFCLGLMV